jgi:type I restriction enzyme M protein
MVTSNIAKMRLFHLTEKIFQGLSPSRSSKAKQYERNIPIINIKDIVDGQVQLNALDAIPVDYKNVDKYVIHSGDVLVTCRGTLLKSAVVPEGIDHSLITSNLIAIRLNGSLDPVLLSAFFQSPTGQKTLLSNVRSSTMQIALTVSDVENIEVPVAPLETQKKLAGLITAANNCYSTTIESANLRREIAYNIVHNFFIKPDEQPTEGKCE